MTRFLPDKFTLMLVCTVALASVLPISGELAVYFGWATKVAIAALFFLHGARLSRDVVIAGMLHWRLHLSILAVTFVIFPLLGLGLGFFVQGFLPSSLYLGILYICVLPSTVQSSIAFTSMAGGNVPAAICSASASNIFGMILTPCSAGCCYLPVAMAGFRSMLSCKSSCNCCFRSLWGSCCNPLSAIGSGRVNPCCRQLIAARS